MTQQPPSGAQPPESRTTLEREADLSRQEENQAPTRRSRWLIRPQDGRIEFTASFGMITTACGRAHSFRGIIEPGEADLIRGRTVYRPFTSGNPPRNLGRRQ